MGFENIIRKGVQIADRITKTMQPSLVYLIWTGADGAGKSSFTESSVRAHVEMSNRIRAAANGREYVQEAIITLLDPPVANGAEGRDEPVDLRDVFILPNGRRSTVVEVIGQVDPLTNGPYAFEIRTGRMLAL
jgi:hypothetical protein